MAAMLGKCCINYRWISMVYYIILLYIDIYLYITIPNSYIYIYIYITIPNSYKYHIYILLFQSLGPFFHQQHHSIIRMESNRYIHASFCVRTSKKFFTKRLINTHQGPKNRVVWSPRGAQFNCQVAKRGSVQSQVGGSKDSDWYQTWVHGEKKTTTPFR